MRELWDKHGVKIIILSYINLFLWTALLAVEEISNLTYLLLTLPLAVVVLFFAARAAIEQWLYVVDLNRDDVE